MMELCNGVGVIGVECGGYRVRIASGGRIDIIVMSSGMIGVSHGVWIKWGVVRLMYS